MKSALTRLAVLAAAAAMSACATRPAGGDGGFVLASPTLPATLELGAEQEFDGFGCKGANRSPALAWSGAPAGTNSFALSVHDPDAPTGSGWWHWVVYDIPADTTALPAGAGDVKRPQLPKGAKQGRTDFGTKGFGGACPPPGHGVHHYHFRLHALKAGKLEVPNDATAALIGYMVNANSIGTAEFVATYERK